jgi:hypothetical protein
LPKGFGIEDVAINVDIGLVSGRGDYGRRRMELAIGVGDHGRTDTLASLLVP